MENNLVRGDYSTYNYKEFEEQCKKSSNLNIYPQYRYVVDFFINNRNQTKTLYLDTRDAFIDNDIVNSFAGFNIIPLGDFKTVNKYIVFVDPCDIEDSYLSEVELNIPSSTSPTHVCILSDDTEIVNYCFGELIKINPNLVLVNIASNFNVSDSLNEVVKKRLKGYPTVSIANYCKELSYLYRDINDYSFYKRFDEVVTEILEISKSGIVYFGGDYSTKEIIIYKLLVTECSLRNINFKFYIEDEDVHEIATKIASCMIDPSHQMVEDVVSFIESFPRLCLELRGDFLLTDMINESTLVLKLKYVPLNTLGSVRPRFAKFKSKQIKVIPISSYYNLESDDIVENVREEEKLKKFIDSLYKVLDLDYGVINLTNLVFFELEGAVCVGYNLGYDLDLKCATYFPGMPLTERRINNFYDLNKFVYFPSFLNGSNYIKKLASSLPNAKFNHTHGKVKTNYRNNFSVLKYTSFVYSDEFLQFPNALFLLGMSSKPNRIFRENICNGLVKLIGLDSVRSKIDSFGCFNKVTNNILEI